MPFKLAPALLFLLAFSYALPGSARKHISGLVVDAESGMPLPFATIRPGHAADGMFSDIDGRFSGSIADSIRFLTISYMGYQTMQYTLDGPATGLLIKMEALPGTLPEVTIRQGPDKVSGLMSKAIAARSLNQPGEYNWYQCRIYYKMTADLLPDAAALKDTTNTLLADFVKDKHMLLSETYSRRSYRKPGLLQDEVEATRISGWRKAPFTSLVTDILPFDTYSDFLKLNGKDFANPVSKGWQARYRIQLEDEVPQGGDTLYILSFRPRRASADNLLSGQFYIHSGNYAIAYFKGSYTDARLGQTLNLVQQYRELEDGRWFPYRLSYEMRWTRFSKSKLGTIGLQISGSSQISDVSLEEPAHFRFDKARPVKLLPGADEVPDDYWLTRRPDTLDNKGHTTYRFMDSVFHEYKIDKVLPFMEKLSEAKIPLSVIDIDLKRLYAYNSFEKSRPGLGIQTNERLLKHISLGGWAGYGFHDKQWKYGGFLELSLDPYKDKMVRLGYNRDLTDPGRIKLHKDIDRGYLQLYMMQRADRIDDFFAAAGGRFGYWNISLEGHYQKIVPQYSYALAGEAEQYSRFNAGELAVSFRYAPGERRAPAFGKYQPVYNPAQPKFYLKLTGGNIQSGPSYQSNYLQVLAAMQWSRRINRVGKESIQLMAGMIRSGQPLPVSKTFAGKGYYNPDYPIYSFGGFATMRPYGYYSDRFISLNWKHDFDWKLYNLASWSKPYLSLAHNLLYGSMEQPSVHRHIAFEVPDKGYHESGVILNDLLKLNYLNIAYFNLHAGYFYHWAPSGLDLKKNGNFVLGISLGL